MNQVVQFQPQASVPVPAFTMSEMERIALAIAKGGLFGSSDPNAVLTLCMVAQAEGKHPAQVMQDYHLISGKPAKKADAMLRDFLAAGGRVEWHRLDDDCADATFSHPVGGEARIAWDKARVAQAQLGGNAMHKKYPRQMLRSRVVSEGVRTVFPGATSGMYVPEEVMDFGGGNLKPTPPAPQAQRAHDMKSLAASAPVIADASPRDHDEAFQADDQPAADLPGIAELTLAIQDDIKAAPDIAALGALWSDRKHDLRRIKAENPSMYDALDRAKNDRRAELGDDAEAA